MSVSRPKRSFDREFKSQVVRQLVGGEKRLSQLFREHQLSATLIYEFQNYLGSPADLVTLCCLPCPRICVVRGPGCL